MSPVAPSHRSGNRSARRANLTGVNLTSADLTGATLTRANLSRANLTGARWPEDAPVPEGWKLDTGSGRLIADTGAETAGAT